MKDTERSKTHTKPDPKSNPPKSREVKSNVGKDNIDLNGDGIIYTDAGVQFDYSMLVPEASGYLTNRDHIAIEAMNALIQAHKAAKEEWIVKQAYIFADEMLKARKNQESKGDEQ